MRRRALPAQYVQDSTSRVWSRPDYSGLAFSDGDTAETTLLDLLHSTNDLGTLSSELAGKISGWTTEAHLSAARSNLLRPFRFRRGQRVLEVGAGCGALTRYLGETGATVDALEGAPARAACIAERCRDQNNVRVICESFTGFDAETPYDVVTLIGVLEYAQLFVEGADAALELLTCARRHLTRDGALVLAIENQLGLKYFNGCQEDHLGTPFPGITDLYAAGSAQTFGRQVLAAYLRNAGFQKVDWYFPFPDYKTPSVVVSERAFSAPEFSVSDLIFGEASRDYSGNPYRVFDETNVWPVLERNGLFAEFANSFLVVACAGEDNHLEPAPWLARKFSTSRRRPYVTATTFARSSDNAIRVTKARLDPKTKDESQTLALVHRLGTEPYIEGTLYARELSKAVGRGVDPAGLASLLTPWIKLLLDRSDASPAESNAQARWSRLRVPGGMLDCVPFNLIIDRRGRLRQIDAEFAIKDPVPLPWVVLRGLLHTASKCFGHRAFFDLTGEQWIREMLPHFGLSDLGDWSPYLELEDKLITSVLLPWPGRKQRDIFRERLSLPVSTQQSYVDAMERSRAAEERAQTTLLRLLEFLRRLQEGNVGDLAAIDGEIAAIASSADEAKLKPDAAAIRGPLMGLSDMRLRLQSATQELATLERYTNKLLEQRDRGWRTLFAEAEARFHLREDGIARALFDTEARLRESLEKFGAAESAATRREAAAAQRERDLHEQLGAAEAAATERERNLHQAIARIDQELKLRGQEMAARDAAAAGREQALHDAMIRAEQAAQAHEQALSSSLGQTQAQHAAKTAEAAELATQLQTRNNELRDLDARLRAQARRTETAEIRLVAIEHSWSYRLMRPFLGAGALGQTTPAASERMVFRATRAAYKLLPLSREARHRLKDAFYHRYGRWFRYVQNYQVWEAQRATTRRPPQRAAQAAPAPQFQATTGVSVVIPAYGKADLTRGCVESVLDSGYAGRVEIIVVDDGSPELLAPALEGLAGVRVIRGETNQGFIAACNRGAAEAREKYLLFLNNDAEIQPGALAEMLRTFEEVPGAGAVGGKLVFPDGRLQEAGARIRPDGTADMIGLWDDPNRGCYEFMREVGYCSGACLMLDRALFASLGGFDAAYAPAYCEDSDLCYRIRANGRKVIYQPRATVVHQLSASSAEGGLDKSAIVAVNQATFLHRWEQTLRTEDSVRAIAFYLPQYHQIPENDEWWGHGFTEWTNVAKARPVFVGHGQPIEPGELGYYDLRSEDVRGRQAELARAHGIHGFCYYYYWFAGKRLLHEPLDQVIASGEPDFPFCICWANENWTRRWDGLDSEILIAQKHSPEDDIGFIETLVPALRDPRYIKVNGRPLLVVYRPALLPDARATAERWRRYCRQQGIGELYLVMVQSFYHLDSTGPEAFGFDAAIEFPPHSLAVEVRNQPKGINGQPFEGILYDYERTAENFLAREMPPYKLFRTVMPRWDNTARRGHHANIFTRATPEAFERWLEKAVEYTKRMYFGDERLVFINAWNEWGEGNFLEPDREHGRKFLEATRHVLAAGAL